MACELYADSGLCPAKGSCRSTSGLRPVPLKPPKGCAFNRGVLRSTFQVGTYVPGLRVSYDLKGAGVFRLFMFETVFTQYKLTLGKDCTHKRKLLVVDNNQLYCTLSIRSVVERVYYSLLPTKRPIYEFASSSKTWTKTKVLSPERLGKA
ncbi:hypothetical protein RhiirA5_369045 [Rhizophagus irregularis]|uniref:Uncharacterized protein n=1 Tax=Rhizophagus irregularis TaxID=588596 RepID=A0A2N0QED4_9GLOM|nr:hypothetical protein RhiirA5_369045 [Rhizophagus irregularis]PKC71290.1 hypothetical protein RhiirA1_390668 [Rhizophagus irregularis]